MMFLSTRCSGDHMTIITEAAILCHLTDQSLSGSNGVERVLAVRMS